MKETYFITGGTGFIGRRLAFKLVEAGKRVVCLARPTSNRAPLAALGVSFIDGDLSDLEALRRGIDGADAVFHLAGLTRETRSGDFQKVNCAGSVNVASACADLGGKRLVAVSSLACAGIGLREPKAVPAGEEAYAPYRLRRETDLPRPLSPYGRSKFAAENELLQFADRVAISVARPPYVFGEGDMASLKLFQMVNKGGKITLPGYLDQFYSFVYVDDLADALIAIEERGERLTPTSLAPTDPDSKGARGTCSGTGVYFVCSPVAIKFSTFGKLIGAAYGRSRVSAIRVPPLGVLGAGVYGEIYKRVRGKIPPFDLNKAIEAVRGPWICSGAKAAAQLGLDFGPELDGKIARTAKWYEREGLL